MTLHHGNIAFALCCFMLALSSPGDGLADTLFKQGSEQSKALNRCALLNKERVLPVKNVTALPDDGGYRVLTNNGRDSHQEVMHLHFHIFAGRPLGPMLEDGALPPGTHYRRS